MLLVEFLIQNRSIMCTEKEGDIIGLDQILPDAYYQQINLIHMYIIEIKKEIVNEAITLTKSYVDNQLQDNYSHVKRCRKSKNDNNNIELLLGPSKDIPSYLLNELTKINTTEKIPVKQIQVSKYAPVTKQQYSEWSQHWPLYFKRPAYINKNTCLTDIEIKKAIYFLNHAIQIGNKYGTCKSGCVLTYKDIIIASSGDNIMNHPLQHAAMLAIEEASYKLRHVLHLKKLLRKLRSEEKKHQINDSEKEKVTEMKNVENWKSGETNFEKVYTEKLKQKEETEEIKETEEREETEESDEKEETEETDEKEETEENHWKKQNWNVSEIKRRLKMYEPLTPEQYLCTNYSAYLSHEPCFMCAMALLHSRVKYVIFDKENTKNGAVYSRVKLHLVKNLNHYYRVYKAKRQK